MAVTLCDSSQLNRTSTAQRSCSIVVASMASIMHSTAASPAGRYVRAIPRWQVTTPTPRPACTAAVSLQTVASLARELEDVRVLDCRPHSDYLAGHIPGAVHCPWTSLVDAQTGLLSLDTDVVAPALEKMGVSMDMPAVVSSGTCAFTHAYSFLP